MWPTVLVAAGGALGSVARHRLSTWIAAQPAAAGFPWATLAVNVAGCLVIGLLAGLNERSGLVTAPARLFLFTGVLGGFTTFSAFGLETYTLLRGGAWVAAGAYVAASSALGVGAVAIGVLLAK